MCRCKACDKPLNPEEIYINQNSGDFEECCSFCKEIAFSSLGVYGYLSDEQAVSLSRKAAIEQQKVMRLMEVYGVIQSY